MIRDNYDEVTMVLIMTIIITIITLTILDVLVFIVVVVSISLYELSPTYKKEIYYIRLIVYQACGQLFLETNTTGWFVACKSLSAPSVPARLRHNSFIPCAQTFHGSPLSVHAEARRGEIFAGQRSLEIDCYQLVNTEAITQLDTRNERGEINH